ncbi:MAG TPA: helix-turn-helix transcriptional regulator [Acholeplasmataceae bacterium]|nr:helix-turn-helix transcriptional regulator [Acholeplasmataceae bacterium]
MNNLRYIRRDRDVTQKELAQIMGVSHQFIGKLEKGKARLNEDHIRVICEALNCSADYLLGLIDKE